ncbi:MAG: hypothetical protein LQ346_005006 [Caloplaca aetnensis]|nr:MAG: hypothetical protein LQ346_005006 [Caloplaca aetnensis]
MIVRSFNHSLAIALGLFLFVSSLAWLSRLSPSLSTVFAYPEQQVLWTGPQKDHHYGFHDTHRPSTDELSRPHSTLAAILDTIDVMQSHYYTIWQGQWPGAIDWTAAVMGTQISATLAVMTEAWHHQTKLSLTHDRSEKIQEHENTINRYFTQITSFYFGENAFSIRTQAYDDMLWVVLGWLESVKFINLHSNLHHAQPAGPETEFEATSSNSTGWYAQQFIPQFAHRARVFYDLAAKGWDTSLCGGGMVWNPYLAPYKNAITNQLFITASISMYLHFPGDNNASPFSFKNPVRSLTGYPPAKAHDPQYLENAVEAYQWLKSSGMRNWKGLYADGFHITGWKGGENSSTGTGKCDLRDEQVYTYNQGVVLSGLRGLWDATGSQGYLDDGHELIRNVIAATGWDTRGTRWRWQWSGLGRNGVMEDACDSRGTCSQNGHTFKGIFFHHLAIFCGELPSSGISEGDFNTFGANNRLAAWHKSSCESYQAWLRNNAQAAYVTRDDKGEFGTWWGIPAGDKGADDQSMIDEEGFSLPPDDGTDYRNDGILVDDIWRLPDGQSSPKSNQAGDTESDNLLKTQGKEDDMSSKNSWDPNDRGRGRTVETQSGGLAVLRALWKIVDSTK